MRLIECIIHTVNGKEKATVDFDNVTLIIQTGDDTGMLIMGASQIQTDIPYEKAVDLWENYHPGKGVTSKFD